MPKLSHASKGKVDYLGAALIVTAGVTLLLALTFGGQKYAWGSPQVLGLFAGLRPRHRLLIVVEQRVPEPMLHLELFRTRFSPGANIAGFFSSHVPFSASFPSCRC